MKPSAFGFVNWNVKSLVNVCTLTAVAQKALATWKVVVVSVSCRRVPFSLVCPLNCMPAAEVKPEPKLIGVPPPLWMVITEVAVALVEKLVAVAIAITVVVLLTLNGTV